MIRQKLLSVIADCLYSPDLLPEAFFHEGKKYLIVYIRPNDDSYIRISAHEDSSSGREVASIMIN